MTIFLVIITEFEFDFFYNCGLLDYERLVRISITNYSCIVMHNKYCMLHDAVSKDIRKKQIT